MKATLGPNFLLTSPPWPYWLSATMFGVFWYASIADRQNTNLTRSVKEDVAINRPVVLTNGIHPVVQDPKTKIQQPAKGPTDSAAVVFAHGSLRPFGGTLGGIQIVSDIGLISAFFA
jgi:hypothetical protein